MKKMKFNRLLSLAVSIIIALSAMTGMTVNVSAAGGSIVYPGGEDYFTDSAVGTTNGSDAWVYISKTAKDAKTNPSLGEDEFEITLTAKTKENLEEFFVIKDTQVLLVLDTSLSMTTYCAECGKTYATGARPCCSNPETRLARTKKAVVSFLDSYAATAAGTSAHRYVAVVEYGIQARYYQPVSTDKSRAWIDVNPLSSGGASSLSSLKTWINGLGTTAGTNTDAALAMADALLTNAAFNPYMSVENKNLVLFTDGMPNMRLTSGQTLTLSGKNPTPYPFPNNAGSAGTQVAYDPARPTQSNQLVYQQPITKATALRNKDINIFTVGYGGDGGTGSTDVYLSGWRAALDWLEVLASSPENAYVVDAVSSLDDMIRSFVEIVEWAVWEGIAPYTLTDPMGPYVIWSPTNTVNSAIGQSFAQNSFVWDLKKAPLPTKDADGWYTYTYTYKVKFDADAAYEADYDTAFNASIGAPLNDTTTLSYAKFVNNVIGTTMVVDFKLPTASFVPPTPVATQYPYTVKYYKDSITEGNLLGSTPGTTEFDAGYELGNADVTADLGADWIDAMKPDGYTSGSTTYVTITINPEDNVVTVVYGVQPQYPYTVKYYVDSVSDSNLIGAADGTTNFDAGYTLVNADVAADLGADWINAKKPSGYDLGSVSYVTITTDPESNIVIVVYVMVEKIQKLPLGWMRSTEVGAESFKKAIVDYDAWSYNEAFDSTPIKYFENADVQNKANEKVAQGTEVAVSEGEQYVGIQHIWDLGNYFNQYKEQNGNVFFDWASWRHWGISGSEADKGEYSIRRFAAYFELTADEIANASNILVAPEDELGNMSYLFPINDNIFLFVNGQLAYWGGTDVVAGDNQFGALNRSTFMGMEGIKVRNGVNGVFQSVYPHTDGWCIDLNENKDAVNIKSLLQPGFNRIDIITDEYWEGGGMNRLFLFAER